MKRLFTILILCVAVAPSFGQASTPLSKYSAEWNDPKYRACNTAAQTTYLSANEKELVYILNMARMNPKLFCSSVVLHVKDVTTFIDTSSQVYYKSLVTLMSHMEPLAILLPDSLCYVSALCHAASSGKTGYVGHDRKTADCRKKEHFRGECCQYGVSDPLEIILCLLVDEDVPSLGHRLICLGDYTKMSPSIQPHKLYDPVAVLDFY